MRCPTTSDAGDRWTNSSPAQFLRSIELQTEGHRYESSRIEMIANGENFYEAELEAISQARQSVTLEAYIFHDHKVGRRFLDVMCDRARNGVQVRLLCDAVGNWHVRKKFFQPLRECGGRIGFFRRVPRLLWFNSRSHREIVVIDGRIAFIGGAGIDDRWLYPAGKCQRWRDTMFRIEGDAAPYVQCIFGQAWLETTGEALAGPGFYGPDFREPVPGGSAGAVVDSRPHSGKMTAARLLFEAVLARAGKSIDITTPYFAPDNALLKALRACARRGVRVRLLLPGGNSDHLLTRAAARICYPGLIRSGVEIYEYRPTMVHAKTLVADGEWSLIGSTNMDFRSLLWNEEISLLAHGKDLAAQLSGQFEEDLSDSKQVHMRAHADLPVKDQLAGVFARCLWAAL